MYMYMEKLHDGFMYTRDRLLSYNSLNSLLRLVITKKKKNKYLKFSRSNCISK